MIDDLDESSSILRLLVADSLKRWTDNALLGLLSEQDAIVRTAAARELQMRGGVTYLRKFSIYLKRESRDSGDCSFHSWANWNT